MKYQKKKKFCIAILCIVFMYSNAQGNKQAAFTFNYNYQVPIGSLSNTYGNNSAIGASYFVEKNNNIIFGIEGSYLFGNNIKDTTIFENISTSTGAIIGSDGRYTDIKLMQRGCDAYIFVGYAFHPSKNNLSGIYISQGIGYLQHKIFIDTKNQNVPQLNENMKEGYDQFSNGISTKFAIDFKYYHKKGRFQISSGFNYIMAHTKNQRLYDFVNQKYYDSLKKWDKLLGFKIEVIIPVNRKNEEEFHYY